MTNRAATIAIMGGICALTLAAAATAARATGNTAYLSRTGTGTTCSLASPCASMFSAIAVAGTSGEVICLDKGAYGVGNITASVTISCGPGLWEAIGLNLSINTPAGSAVVIEGLVLDHLGTSQNAITFTGQGSLHLRGVRIGNSNGSNGLQFIPTGPATLHITDSVFYAAGGILIRPQGSGSVQAAITRTAFERNSEGIFVEGAMSTGQIQVQVNDSVIANSASNGVDVNSGSALVVVSLSNSQVVGNQIGVAAGGSLAVVILDRTTVQANTVQALFSTGGSAIYSYGNNPINDNAALGASLTVIGLH
jgi:hypothetical protein